MAKLEIPQEQAVPGAQAGNTAYSMRIRESSANAAARVGGDLESYGKDVGDMSGRLGTDMQDVGQKYVNEATNAVNDASYNRTYSTALTDFSSQVNQRLQAPYDANGNPTYSTLPQDIAKIGQTVSNKYAAQLADPATNQKFVSDFNTVVTNHQITSMGTARKQLVDDAVSSAQKNLQTLSDTALASDPIHLGTYYAQGLSVLNKAQANGYITPDEAEQSKEQFRHGLYYNSAQLMNDKDPMTAKQWIQSEEYTKNLTPIEQATLLKSNATAIQTMNQRALAKQKEQQALVKQQQTFNNGELQIKLAKGQADENSVTDAYNQGHISHDQYVQNVIKLETAKGNTAKAATTNAAINMDVHSGNILTGYASKDVDNWYNAHVGLITKKDNMGNIIQPSLSDKASIAMQAKTPIHAFTNDLKNNFNSGNPDAVLQATNAYASVLKSNPLAVSTLDKKSVAMASMIEDQMKNTDPKVNSTQKIVQNAINTVNLDPEKAKYFASSYGKEKDFTQKNFKDTVANMYGANHTFGNDQVDSNIYPTVQRLLKEAYPLVGGSSSAAQNMVTKETAGLIGASSINGKRTVMLAPPETSLGKNYSTEQIRGNLEAELGPIAKEQGIDPSKLQISTDGNTTMKAGSPAYTVSYQDKDGNVVPLQDKSGNFMYWKPTSTEIDKQIQEQAHNTAATNIDPNNASLHDIQARPPGFAPNLLTPMRASQIPVPDTKSENLQGIMRGIASVETPGSKTPYSELGPVVKSGEYAGQQAIGKYQVMPGNIPGWSKEALGYSITPEQFKDNPQLQDRVVSYQLNKLMDKYGDAADVMAAWHSGGSLEQAVARGAHDQNMSTLDYVRSGMGNMQEGNIPTDAKSQTADQGQFITNQQSSQLNNAIISVPHTAMRLDPAIGDALSRYTDEKEGTPYGFGNKTTNEGSVDCSGWVAENTLHAMQEINQRTGANTYDVNTMKSLMNQGAAWQISGIAKMTGYLDDQDVRSGAMPNGTLIGISRPNPPEWAEGRPNQVSHIVQVLTKNGEKYVSQSAGSMGGVSYIPLDHFLANNKDSKLYAVNPFNLVSSTSQQSPSNESGPLGGAADQNKQTTPSQMSNDSPTMTLGDRD